MVPRTVLTRSGLISLNTARPVNTVQPRTVVNNAGPMKNVNIVKGTRVNTSRPKAVLSAVKGNKGNVVKASACWVWRPKHKVLDHGNPQQDLKNKGVIDSRCSRHMTGNRSNLTDYKEIDSGFVAFGGNSKGEKITRKGRKPVLSFIRPVGCLVTILNTIDHLGTKACDNTSKDKVETVPGKDYILLPLWTQDLSFSSSLKDSPNAGFKPLEEEEKKGAEYPGNEGGNPTEEGERVNQEKDASVNSINTINTVSPTVNAASIEDNAIDENRVYGCADDPSIPNLEEIGRFSDAKDDGVEADMTNLDTHIPVSPIPTTRIHKDHLVEQIIGDIHSAPQTRRMTKSVTEHAMFKPKKVIQALKDPSWIEAMQEELLQFKLQQVWTLVDLPHGKRAIGTKWVYRNKKERSREALMIGTRLVGCSRVTHKEEELIMMKMDVKSDFMYGKIKEVVFVCQPLGFEDPDFPDRVYKVEKALYRLHQAPRGLVYVDDILFGSTKKKKLCLEFEKMMPLEFQMVYMVDCQNSKHTLRNPKPSLKDVDGEDIDEHMYRSMIGSLMYLTSSRPDIMFVGIFYLKGQPKLGLWYPKDSSFDLVAYTESDYAGASLDRKSTTGEEVNYVNMQRILHKGWLEWNAKAAKDGIRVKTGNSRVNAVGHYLILLGKKNADFAEKVDFLNANPIRQGKDFSRTVTPLFSSMLAQQAHMGEGSRQPTDPQYTSTSAQPSNKEPITVPSSSQPKKTHRPRKVKRATKISQSSRPISLVADETITKEREDKIERSATTASSLEEE
ncbi:putative ribonuclease H-like domain-containing protein [Tanacetum coccineum]|uniref:Ribonuclease H-like domain-containing protein n=1 Tax=Tanacetum coccineum TaxID=301880 RepID=A0ABQ5CAC5_9ASTR